MTQKHFIAIARILAGDFQTAALEERMKVWTITLSLADYFAGDNPRFDRDLFYKTVFGTSDHFGVRDSIIRALNEQAAGWRA
jgi:hypothetical protein